MKKRLSVLTLILILAASIMPAAVSADTYRYISDEADLLKADQEVILETRSTWLSDNFSLGFITTSGDNQTASEAFAAAMPQTAGGSAVMCINGNDGNVTFNTYGAASEIITEDIRAEIEGIAKKQYSSVGVYDSCQSVSANVYNLFYGEPLISGGFYEDPIVDYAGYLTESENAELSKKLDAIRTKYNMDVAVCIDSQMWKETSMASADDTYDYYLYGAGEDDDGIILYISKEPREYWISTFEDGMIAFNDAGISEMKSRVVEYLSADDYYGAVNEFADTADEFLSLYEQGTPYDGTVVLSPAEKAAGIAVAVVIAAIISLIAAFVLNRRKLALMNTAREQAYAHEYLKPGTFQLHENRDYFMYRTLDKTRIEKSDSSSSHISSSGRSHGGGGGSY